ncbi:MAG: FAD-dependent oxidoreductase [Verrucomicrobia bacterium]|nr:FAD-dependent oxidoreductase [Verrucomicrobiota bacterium]
MNSTCDVLVAGGGVAGVPAAVAACRAGARTVLVERENFLGGMGVTALHRYICGLYLNSEAEPSATLNPGLPREVVARLRALSPASHPLPMGRGWGFPFEPAHLRAVYERLAQGEANLIRLLSSTVQAVERNPEGSIVRVTVQSPEGEHVFSPRAVIDATGSGAVLRLAGAPIAPASEPGRQPGGCTLHLAGINGDRQMLAIKIAWQLGRLPPAEAVGLPPFGGFTADGGEGEGFCKFTLSPEFAQQGKEAIQKCLDRMHALLASKIPELAHSRIVGRFHLIESDGVRLAGDWELDESSILTGRKFPNSVVRNAWPVESWEAGGSSPLYAYPPEGDYYEIPRRCLNSRAVPNLFATGRCISATQKAVSSTRPMGTCIALGEAAGKLAAIYR